MFIAYELVNFLGSSKTVSQREFDKYWPQVVSVLERNVFVNRLGEVPEKEKQVLIRIASIEENQVSPSMIKEVKGVTEFLSRLERKGLLLKKERGQYELFHPLFKEYLRKLASD
jgi:ATP/maltotriose-dependent transcriptional regulator MalT